jgi:uncharacterized protein
MKNTVTLDQMTREAFPRRVWAGVIDLTLWITLFIPAAMLLGTSATTGQGASKSTHLSLTGVPALIFTLVELAYFVVLEWQFGGTVGKLLLGVRVVDERGRPIGLKQSVIRNVLRVVDAFPYVVPYIIGLLLVAGDQRKRRLGDRAANTLVVLKSGQRRPNDWNNLS